MFSMVLVLLVGSFISAGFFDDFYAKITGKVQSSSTTLNITLTANNPPTITWVEEIVDITPNEGGVNYTTFNFTATDTDGFSNINLTSAQARFQLTGETTRSNTSCVNYQSGGDQINFTCTIGMYYFDNATGAGGWTINVTVKDNVSVQGENSSTGFQYNSFPAMVMSPTALAWTAFGVSDTDQESSSNPITINNTGNGLSLSINITAYDLPGNNTATEFIYAGNLTINNVGANCAGGTEMVNGTASANSKNITSAILWKGNNSLNNNDATSGQEQLFFCVTAVNTDLSTQEYSSLYGAWAITIIT